MTLYNVEFYTKELNYVGSQQISTLSIEYDYLSPDESSINIELTTNCEIDNIICIRAFDEDKTYLGIVTTINENRNVKIVKFKPLLSLFDVPIIVGTVSGTIEQWIADKITETYVSNSDELQNIPILDVEIRTETKGTIDVDTVTTNFLEVLGNMLKKYIIFVDFKIDFINMRIKAIISANEEESKVIESDLPNVISKTLEIKTQATEVSINKITIINTSDDGNNETVTYYRELDGNITNINNPVLRIMPVIFTIKEIQCKSAEFDNKALETATAELAEDDFNNLIELTVLDNDELIKPYDFEIGQKVLIISNNEQYVSYLTGYKMQKGTIRLIFGAIRLELTKKLKRRMK